MRFILSLVGISLLPTAVRVHGAEEPAWVGPTKKVHARFTGKPGTFAQFGDSITITMAFWAPLRQDPKGLDAAGARALERVKKYMKDDCWSGWKGADYG